MQKGMIYPVNIVPNLEQMAEIVVGKIGSFLCLPLEAKCKASKV